MAFYSTFAGFGRFTAMGGGFFFGATSGGDFVAELPSSAEATATGAFFFLGIGAGFRASAGRSPVSGTLTDEPRAAGIGCAPLLIELATVATRSSLRATATPAVFAIAAAEKPGW